MVKGMFLKDLLKDVEVIRLSQDLNPEIKGITINSKTVSKDFLFCAIPGFKKDGHDFVPEAARNGASAVLVQRELAQTKNIIQILVKDCRKELAVLSRNYFKDPASGLILCGITGTNGKTTTVFLTNSIFNSAGIKTSYITTVQAEINLRRLFFDRTTPESLELNDFFYKSILDNVQAACMEISSHSIDLHRVSQLDFDYFAFTNLTQDHLDYHLTMDNYFEVKSRLFMPEYRDIFNGKGAVINIDDYYGKKLAKKTDLDVLTFSIKNSDADIVASDIKNSIEGIIMNIALSRKAVKINESLNGLKNFSICSSLCGDFNVYNILASIGLGIFAGIDIKNIIEGTRTMSGVKGRFEKFNVKDRYAIVDYAHTPDGLENVLRTARLLLRPGARLICVFGCGGDRDKKKRKIMGEIAAKNSDYSIITSDNPRSEDPEEIIKMIEQGFTGQKVKKYTKEVNRKKAIFEALSGAHKNDIIVIAGKGHEDYQEFSDGRIHFSDQEVVLEWAAF